MKKGKRVVDKICFEDNGFHTYDEPLVISEPPKLQFLLMLDGFMSYPEKATDEELYDSQSDVHEVSEIINNYYSIWPDFKPDIFVSATNRTLEHIFEGNNIKNKLKPDHKLVVFFPERLRDAQHHTFKLNDRTNEFKSVEDEDGWRHKQVKKTPEDVEEDLKKSDDEAWIYDMIDVSVNQSNDFKDLATLVEFDTARKDVIKGSTTEDGRCFVSVDKDSHFVFGKVPYIGDVKSFDFKAHKRSHYHELMGFSKNSYNLDKFITYIMFDNKKLLDCMNTIQELDSIEELITYQIKKGDLVVTEHHFPSNCLTFKSADRHTSTGCVILAGGEGSRFLDGQLPKVTQVNSEGKTLLESNISQAQEAGITEIAVACPKNELGMFLVKHINPSFEKDLYCMVDKCSKFEFLSKLKDERIAKLMFNETTYTQDGLYGRVDTKETGIIAEPEKLSKKDDLFGAYMWETENNPFYCKDKLLILNGDSNYPQKAIDIAMDYFRDYMNHPDDAGAVVMLKPQNPVKKSYNLIIQDLDDETKFTPYDDKTTRFKRVNKEFDGWMRMDPEVCVEKALLKGIESKEVQIEFEPAFYMVKTEALRALDEYKLGTNEFFKKMVEQGKRIHVLRIDMPYQNMNDLDAYNQTRQKISDGLLKFLDGNKNG